jgi:ParB family chromosome partitioning protein
MSSHGGTVTYNAHGASNRASAARAQRAGGKAGGGKAGGGKAGGGKGKASQPSVTGRAEPRSAPKTTPLGKLAQAEAQATPREGEILRLPISSIRAEINPRERFDPEGIAELAASIREHGGQPLQPPTVRPKGDGTYQLIAGERRMRAMQALGQHEMDVIVRNVSEGEARKLAMIENINRLDMTPSETGRAYAALKRGGMSEADIANVVGKHSESALQSVRDHLALVETLEPHLQKLVDNAATEGRGKGLPFSLVRGLATLTPEHREQAAERIMSKGLGVKASKDFIAELRRKENQISLFDSVPTTSARSQAAHEKYRSAMDTLTRTLGGLDNKTVEDMMPSLGSPYMEQQRLTLAIRQLQRMSAIVGRSIARDEAAGI